MGPNLFSAPRIEKRRRIHEVTLRRLFMDRDRPLVFGGAVDDWKALLRWSPDYFRARFGGLPIPCSGTGATLCDLFEAFDDQQSPHLWGLPLRSFSEELSDDVGTYRSVEETWLPHPWVPQAWSWLPGEGPELEIGGPGSVSPLRCEPLGGYRLLTQVAGSQRVALLPPEAAPALEPRATRAAGLRSSLTELERVDVSRHPALAETPIWVTHLQPGETLYVPPHWWHEGKISSEVSISVASLRVSRANYRTFLAALWSDRVRHQPVRALSAQVYLRAYGLIRRFRARNPRDRLACVQ